MDGEIRKVMPLKLRLVQSRFLVHVAFEEEPLHFDAMSHDAGTLAKRIRIALDAIAPTICQLDAHDPRHLIWVDVEEKFLARKAPCPDASEYTTEYWEGLEPGDERRDCVMWMTRAEGCRLVRVHLALGAAFYWIHDTHPRTRQLQEIAQRSLDEHLPIRYRTYHKRVTMIGELALL